MIIEPDIKLDFKDVLIRPKRSTLTTRKEVDLNRKFSFVNAKLEIPYKGHELIPEYSGIPIMASNMDGVGTVDVADALIPHGMFTCLTKIYSEKELVDFFTYDTIISFQNNNKEPKKLKLKNIKKGKGYINSTGEMIKQEMDFSKKNYISITDLHRIMKILFFPKKFKEEERFNLTNEQREILLNYMSGYPKDFGYSPEEFPHYFTKFFIYGDKELELDENIIIYNKVGFAYGQLSDVAHIKKNNVSIILTATIDVNTNKIYNDDKYDYDSIGFPFLAEISREIIKTLSN